MKFPPITRTRLNRFYDWVGPADSVSRIRPIRLKHPYDETAAEREYRIYSEQLSQWNHQFWKEHNLLYERKKAEFLASRHSKILSRTNGNNDEISEFYKNFLAERYPVLSEYNREWYRRNFKLLWLATKASVVRFCRFPLN